ncbi:MAG: TetR family transcriptional regulator [Solirubrobacterales bacterium]
MAKSETRVRDGARVGLRERKKAQTRQQIADTARRLFLERGFDAVTVAEVAREAEVAQKTVFNYFPSKEDLFYGRLEAFEEELLAAVRERRPGESVIAAFREFVMKRRGALQLQDDEEATRQMRAINRVIRESPALLAREREVFDRYRDSLAELLASEMRSPERAIEPRVVASALIDVHRLLIGYVRERTLAGDAARDIARGVRAEGKRAFALLERGLGDYGVKA